MDNAIEKKYQKLKLGYEKDLKVVKGKDNNIVLLRGLIVVLSIGFIIYGYFEEVPNLLLYLLPPVLIFMYLVKKHQKLRKRISYLENMVKVNEHGLMRVKGNWNSNENSGTQFIDPEHPYSKDLDIFGRGSLYQFINSTTFFMGEETLARMLKEEPRYEQISPRQQAVQDLAGRLEWRQYFQATGLSNGEQNSYIKTLLNWASDHPLLAGRKHIYLLALLPLTTVILITLTVLGLIPTTVPLVTLTLQVLIVTFSQKYTYPVFNDTEKASEVLHRFQTLIISIEEEKFKAPLLVDLQRKLSGGRKRASQGIKELSKNAELLNMRYSVVYHFVNALTFCDLYLIYRMDKWKNNFGIYINKWFMVVGEFEALCSFSVLAHDNTDWVFPEVTEEKPAFTATSLGHPLINQKTRVCNDVTLSRPGTVLIITGSNMSGKSTLLRTVGVNLVLAYAGAPVCANGMKTAFMKIYTSIRVEDSLEQNTSAFYAELKRMKKIIDATQERQSFIFMLDEIFRGTNSRDRILGAKTIIKNLSERSTIGFVTTHDLELSTLEREHPQYIINYHFTDQIINDQLTFDYKLKPGVSKTTNAIALMKMIGINVS